MARRYFNFFAFLFVTIVAVASAWFTLDQRNERVHGQGVISEIIGPSLDIRTKDEFDAFAASVTNTDLSAEIQAQVDAGSRMLYLGFKKLEGSASLYKGQVVFEAPAGGVMQGVSWDYCSVEGTCDYAVVSYDNEPLNLAPAVLLPADPSSWTLFFDILAQPPEDVSDLLGDSTLVRIWAEAIDYADDWRVVYLQYGDESQSRTLRVRGMVVGDTVHFRHVGRF